MCAVKNKKPYFWVLVLASLAVQWLRLAIPMQGAWVRSLLGELRSHVLQSVAKKKTLLFFSSFFVWAELHGMWNLSSPPRDRTYAPCSGSVES